MDKTIVELSNNGSMEFDIDDGTIRYIDSDGNCQDLWRPGEENYNEYKNDYFPNCEINKELEN